ncbi:hypothetical protein HYT18_00195 [Candidatus Microgenomates bacterium]|nr:hypothetical protein [Candidatus Microgenomates bacterium]
MTKKLIVILSFVLLTAVSFSQIAMVEAVNPNSQKPTSPRGKKPTSPGKGHHNSSQIVSYQGVYRFLSLN